MFWKKRNLEISYNKKNFFVRHIWLLLSIAALLGTFFIGFYAGELAISRKGQKETIKTLINKDIKATFSINQDVDFNLFWKVWDKIKTD